MCFNQSTQANEPNLGHLVMEVLHDPEQGAFRGQHWARQC
jgi:hypothetical protein